MRKQKKPKQRKPRNRKKYQKGEIVDKGFDKDSLMVPPESSSLRDESLIDTVKEGVSRFMEVFDRVYRSSSPAEDNWMKAFAILETEASGGGFDTYKLFLDETPMPSALRKPLIKKLIEMARDEDKTEWLQDLRDEPIGNLPKEEFDSKEQELRNLGIISPSKKVFDVKEQELRNLGIISPSKTVSDYAKELSEDELNRERVRSTPAARSPRRAAAVRIWPTGSTRGSSTAISSSR